MMILFSKLYILFYICIMLLSSFCKSDVNIKVIEVLGPGLKPDVIVMPARYFYIHFRGRNYTGEKSINEESLEVDIGGETKDGRRCQLWKNLLNRRDGSFIVRYKLYETCYNFYINILYNAAHITSSPYFFKGPIQPEDCYCPKKDIKKWLEDFECNTNYNQLQIDLNKFHNVNFDAFHKNAVNRFNNSQQSSVCNYVVKSNKVYRTCYGQHIGFKIFMDAILISLARKVILPDFEIFSNLGDWPLMKNEQSKAQFPMFSWCGSKETMDIVMPTYDLTEASLQCMGRNEEHKYGPKAKHESFFKFFDYKYQLNLDGTVAAYRFPFLLIGDSVVFKQDSPYYEHFYSDLTPWVHYIPIKKDLSNLVELLKWAKRNDDKVKEISKAGRAYAENNLLPQHVFCYHATLFHEWSKKLISSVEIREGMELVEEPDSKGCHCDLSSKDEL
ncbi:protein O-glucosyltransferase 2-like isoform X2 [Rhodnius prolixus]|uniref:protein O-glucosyltransferase 2-like isoform X2 n=1 Tax=Rhodnius prolixus TaxID=13249 RepID=UPI003D18DB9F